MGYCVGLFEYTGITLIHVILSNESLLERIHVGVNARTLRYMTRYQEKQNYCQVALLETRTGRQQGFREALDITSQTFSCKAWAYTLVPTASFTH